MVRDAAHRTHHQCLDPTANPSLNLRSFAIGNHTWREIQLAPFTCRAHCTIDDGAPDGYRLAQRIWHPLAAACRIDQNDPTLAFRPFCKGQIRSAQVECPVIRVPIRRLKVRIGRRAARRIAVPCPASLIRYDLIAVMIRDAFDKRFIRSDRVEPVEEVILRRLLLHRLGWISRCDCILSSSKVCRGKLTLRPEQVHGRTRKVRGRKSCRHAESRGLCCCPETDSSASIRLAMHL